MFCRGFSMTPTIRRSDVLRISSYDGKRVRPGDVVVFKSTGQTVLTVHRVLSRDATGIKTAGDNNDEVDPEYLKPGDIIGRVDYLQRGFKLKRVHRGWSGSLIGRVMRLRRLLDYRLSRIGRPAYEWLIRHKVFIKWPFGSIRIKVVSFTRNGAQELQLLWGTRVIGWFAPEFGTWRIKRPFRLFIDESSLPFARTEKTSHSDMS
jgi:signal peptidase I